MHTPRWSSCQHAQDAQCMPFSCCTGSLLVAAKGLCVHKERHRRVLCADPRVTAPLQCARKQAGTQQHEQWARAVHVVHSPGVHAWAASCACPACPPNSRRLARALTLMDSGPRSVASPASSDGHDRQPCRPAATSKALSMHSTRTPTLSMHGRAREPALQHGAQRAGCLC